MCILTKIVRKYIGVISIKHNHNEEKQAKLSRNEIKEDSFDIVNKYGTYNIQPTNDTDNAFPAVSQGLAKKKK